MSDDPDLAQFAREHVRSVWGVELLLVLKRDPARRWPPEALVAELRASTSLVVDALMRFERSGLAMRDEGDGWRYAPANPILAELADRLQAAYRERPVSVINLIAAPPDPVQGLADAFKFRGDK
jgi:hypothetical protein